MIYPKKQFIVLYDPHNLNKLYKYCKYKYSKVVHKLSKISTWDYKSTIIIFTQIYNLYFELALYNYHTNTLNYLKIFNDKYLLHIFLNFKKIMLTCPGWCGSVDWVLAYEPTGCQFDSRCTTHTWVAGHVPSGGHARGNHTLMFLSLSFSLPSPL